MTRREGGGGSTYPHDNFSDKTGVMQDANRRNKGGIRKVYTNTKYMWDRDGIDRRDDV